MFSESWDSGVCLILRHQPLIGCFFFADCETQLCVSHQTNICHWGVDAHLAERSGQTPKCGSTRHHLYAHPPPFCSRTCFVTDFPNPTFGEKSCHAINSTDPLPFPSVTWHDGCLSLAHWAKIWLAIQCLYLPMQISGWPGALATWLRKSASVWVMSLRLHYGWICSVLSALWALCYL